MVKISTLNMMKLFGLDILLKIDKFESLIRNNNIRREKVIQDLESKYINGNIWQHCRVNDNKPAERHGFVVAIDYSFTIN